MAEWYIDDSGNVVDLDTIVDAEGVVSVDVIRVTRRDYDGLLVRTQWRNAGTYVDPEALAVAKAKALPGPVGVVPPPPARNSSPIGSEIPAIGPDFVIGVRADSTPVEVTGHRDVLIARPVRLPAAAINGIHFRMGAFDGDAPSARIIVALYEHDYETGLPGDRVQVFDEVSIGLGFSGTGISAGFPDDAAYSIGGGVYWLGLVVNGATTTDSEFMFGGTTQTDPLLPMDGALVGGTHLVCGNSLVLDGDEDAAMPTTFPVDDLSIWSTGFPAIAFDTVQP